MPDPLPLPVRVLVNGDSAVSWPSWWGGPRTDFTFPRAIESVLNAGGRSVDVRNSSKLAISMHHLFRTWERDVVHWSPDVVVVAAGMYDTIHLFLPRWFERHANRVDRRPGRIRNLYFRVALRVFWRFMIRVQAKLDSLLGRPVKRRLARRVARDLNRYIELVQAVAHPLIVILEILPPYGEAGLNTFPGMAGRVPELNKHIRELVNNIDDPEVCFMEIAPIANRLGRDQLDGATGDGIHYSPELHRAIGAELAQLIEEWALEQPYLTTAYPDPDLGTSVLG